MNRVHFDDTTTDDGTYVYVDGVPFSGEVVDTADDGTVISINTYAGGRQEGPQREFHYDGSPSRAFTAVRGVPVGEAWEWFAGGGPARLRVFDDSGRLVVDKSWVGGEPVDTP